MALEFHSAEPFSGVSRQEWLDSSWQMRNSFERLTDFEKVFELTDDERRAFETATQLFRIRVTPYYASLADRTNPADPIRRILMPHSSETLGHEYTLPDPLGENQHRPVKRLVHRYPDRVLFLVTDFCNVYCRYCLRKHFTGQDQAFPAVGEYEAALLYIRSNPAIREVILSGGDPLTLSDQRLQQVLQDLRAIDHVEIIRVGSRIPVVNPMRITTELAQILRRAAPVFFMAHFNHPRELTAEAAQALTTLVDHGIPVMNQMVLLNGVNNHPAIVQALSRRLLYLRVKPYYMFQCDPSDGTRHLQTSVEESLEIQRELWGRLSGLAMPNLSLDIPGGGGKVGLVPDFEMGRRDGHRQYRGWDGYEGEYISPDFSQKLTPEDVDRYIAEWNLIRNSPYGSAATRRERDDSQPPDQRDQRQSPLER